MTIFWIMVCSVIFFYAFKGKKKGNTQSAKRHSLSPAQHQHTRVQETGRTSSSFAPKAEKRMSKEYRWNSKGTSVIVQGHEIPGGMFYTGAKADIDPVFGGFVIGLNAQVAAGDVTSALPISGYYPTYKGLSAHHRLAYIRFLQGNRRDEKADIGYVFLYFYGLEKRLFGDEGISKSESLEIIEEVKGLLSAYGHNNSFRAYASQFINFATAAQIVRYLEGVSDLEIMLERHTQPNTPQEQVALARLAATCGDNLPLPIMARMAMPSLAGVIPSFWYIQKIPREFGITFAAEIEPPPPRSATLFQVFMGGSNIRYNTAGVAGGSVNIATIHGARPTATIRNSGHSMVTKAAIKAGRNLVEYARHVGNHPERRDSFKAIGLMPKCLLEASPVAQENLAWLDAQISTGMGYISLDEIIQRSLGQMNDKLTVRYLMLVEEVISHLNYTIEPQPTEKGIIVSGDMKVAVIKGRRRPETNVLLMIDASMTLLFGLKIDDQSQRQAICDAWLKQSIAVKKLTAQERFIILARYKIRYDNVIPTMLIRAKRALKTLETVDQGTALALVTQSLNATDYYQTHAVADLQKVYKYLDAPTTSLHEGLHAGAANGPVEVAPAQASVIHKIPLRPGAPSMGEHKSIFNREVIRAVEAETEQVQAALREVFAGNEEDMPSSGGMTSELKTEKIEIFCGLDTGLGLFLKDLVVKGDWSRQEFDDLARRHGQMPDGALDALNEWAYDQYGQAIIEDGELLKVEIHLLNG